jgi:hypothetical protein
MHQNQLKRKKRWDTIRFHPCKICKQKQFIEKKQESVPDHFANATAPAIVMSIPFVLSSVISNVPRYRSNRISDSFSSRDMALIANSRFKATLRLACDS